MTASNHKRVTNADLLEKKLGQAVAFLAVTVFLYSVFGGVIRFGLTKINAMFVNNIPAVLTGGFLIAYYLEACRSFRLRWFMVFLALLIAFYAALLPMTNLTDMQMVMGFYIWMPFLLGALLAVYEKETVLFRWMPLFWGVTVLGVLINYLIDFPWVGVTYDVNGVTMNVARSWSAEGFSRLPGFSRMSISAACIILMSYAVILVSSRSTLFKITAYLLSALAIGLTTSKTELGLLLLLPIIFWTYRGIKNYAPETRLGLSFVHLVIGALVIGVIALPVATATHQSIRMSGPLHGFITGDTLIERMTFMWPNAFDLVQHDGNPVTGRGIGGIGTPLLMHVPAPDTPNAADNQFVYLYVKAGLLAVLPFFWAYLNNLGYLYRRDQKSFELFFVLSFCVLGISVTLAPIEEIPVALIMGILTARGYVRFREDKIKALR